MQHEHLKVYISNPMTPVAAEHAKGFGAAEDTARNMRFASGG